MLLNILKLKKKFLGFFLNLGNPLFHFIVKIIVKMKWRNNDEKSSNYNSIGFEEGETLTIADIIKRAHLQCDLVGFEQEVKGGHEIIVRCDHILNETLLDYDMVIFTRGLWWSRSDEK